MKQIFILLTKYADYISTLVYYLGGRGYTHSSIALEEDPTRYYSFNYKGFAVETLEKHKKRGVRRSRLYQLQVSDEVYEKIRKQIQHFCENRDDYSYTKLGLFCCMLHLPLHWKQHYFCSQFVAELLTNSGALLLPKSPCCYLPNHFIQLMEHQPCLVHTALDVI